MGRLLSLLASETGLSEYDVRRIVGNAPIRYKTYTIKKKNGDDRTISQPARELKALQRILMHEVLSNLPVHSAATAYRSGVSIRNNAAAHAENGPILKFDFEDFFPSIRSSDWQSYCQRTSIFDDPEDVRVSTSIFFSQILGLTRFEASNRRPLIAHAIKYSDV